MQGAYSKNKKYQLPRPYGLKPKDNKMPRAYFTTPMKKMFGYLVLLFMMGSIIYMFGPGNEKEEDSIISLDTSDDSNDNFMNTGASAKKNAKLSVDEVIDETNKNALDEADKAGAEAGAAGII